MSRFVKSSFMIWNPPENVTCPLGNLRTKLTSLIAKSTSPRSLDTTLLGMLSGSSLFGLLLFQDVIWRTLILKRQKHDRTWPTVPIFSSLKIHVHAVQPSLFAHIGSNWGRWRVSEGSMWFLCRDDVRLITIYERCSVAMPSLIFYKRGCHSLQFTIRTCSVQTKNVEKYSHHYSLLQQGNRNLQAESEKSDLSQPSQGTESSQEETEH